MALTLRGIDDYENGLIHHSDKGSQYVANDYTDLLCEFGIQISMCTNVLENAHMERANGTIKNEYLKRWPVNSAHVLPKWLKKAVDGYNNRAHKSLNNKTPIEYETYVKELSKNQKIKKSKNQNGNFYYQ